MGTVPNSQILLKIEYQEDFDVLICVARQEMKKRKWPIVLEIPVKRKKKKIHLEEFIRKQLYCFQ
jgi:vacuolar-type H+-ATPase subunit F/Vma7